MADLRIKKADLAAAITDILTAIKKGVYDAQQNGQLDLLLPEKVDFSIQVVAADDFNTIERTVVRTPDTTQTEHSGEGGSDTSHEEITYENFDI